MNGEIVIPNLPAASITDLAGARLDRERAAVLIRLDWFTGEALQHAIGRGRFESWWTYTGGPSIAYLIQNVQTTSIWITADQLAASLRDLTGLDVPPADVLPPTRSRVGRMPYGGTTVNASILETNTIFKRNTRAGMEPADAISSALGHWKKIAGSEPHRLNRAIIADATDRPEWSGWARQAEPGACPFCFRLESRAGVYSNKATAARTKSGQRYHSHCRCRAVPALDERAGNQLRDGGIPAWNAMKTAGARLSSGGR